MASNSTSVVNLTAGDVKNISAALRNVASFSVDWKAVCEEVGIKRGDNAATSFKKTLGKFGLTLQKDQIISLDGTAPAATPKTPKKRAAGEDGGTPASKKRKANGKKDGEAEAEADDGDAVAEKVDTPVKPEDI